MKFKLIFLTLLLMNAFAPSHVLANSDAVVVEWAPFILKDGVNEQAFLLSSEKLQSQFLEKQRGYLKRELLRGRDDQWVDLVYWVDQEAADIATKNAMESPYCLEYFSFMKEVDHTDPGEGVLHFQKIKAWGNGRN